MSLNQTKKIKWLGIPTPSDKYIRTLNEIKYFRDYLLAEWPKDMSNFYSRIKNKIRPIAGTREYEELTRALQRDGTISIRARDMDEFFRIYEEMDNELRSQRIDLDLRSEPTIVNMPESIEKEMYIKKNKDTLF